MTGGERCPPAIVAWGAISGLGEGTRAVSAGNVGEPAQIAIALDPELTGAGLGRPFAARAAIEMPPGDRATALLVRAFAACARALDLDLPGWRARRVGIAVGTSSGGMRSSELFFRGDVGPSRDVTYFAPLHDALVHLGITASPATLILGACASSAIAIGIGARWIETGRCDVVLAGGFDAVSVFVAAGFEALRATTASAPRPFRTERDGMALGEGAAIVALAPAGVARAHGYVAGFSATCDAVHVTAPDRMGAGLARAASAALVDAGVGPEAVDLISAHATATPYNDASEARALATVFGARSAEIPVHPFKAQIGHTLGAAGALESLASLDAMARGVLPAAAGEGALDPNAPVYLLEQAARGAPRVTLKLASAFGGANAALVLSRDALRARFRRSRAVYVTRAVHIASPPASPPAICAPQTWARADGLVRLALAAVAALQARLGSLSGAGMIVGHALATLETNARFDANLRERGARAAEPRRFPYTSPNAVCGECAVHFRLTGPAFAVGAGLHGAVEAIAIARDLVSACDADRIVVVAVDEIGPTASRLGSLSKGLISGAVATLVTADPSGAAARLGNVELVLGPAAPVFASETAGHLALVPLAQVDLPNCLAISIDDVCGAFAKIALMSV